MRAFYTNPILYQTFRYKSMEHTCIIDLEYEGVFNFSFRGQVSLAHVPVRPSGRLLIRQKVDTFFPEHRSRETSQNLEPVQEQLRVSCGLSPDQPQPFQMRVRARCGGKARMASAASEGVHFKKFKSQLCSLNPFLSNRPPRVDFEQEHRREEFFFFFIHRTAQPDRCPRIPTIQRLIKATSLT